MSASAKKQLIKIVHFIRNSAPDVTFGSFETRKITGMNVLDTDCRVSGTGDSTVGAGGGTTGVTGWASGTRGSTLCGALLDGPSLCSIL